MFPTPTVGSSVCSDHVPVMFTTDPEALISTRNYVPRPLFRSANWLVIRNPSDLLPPHFPTYVGTSKYNVDAATKALTDVILEPEEQNIPKSKPSNFKHPQLEKHIVIIIKIKRTYIITGKEKVIGPLKHK